MTSEEKRILADLADCISLLSHTLKGATSDAQLYGTAKYIENKTREISDNLRKDDNEA